MNETEIELLKIVRSDLVTGEARIYDHVSATFRWLMATLFAANGGAIVVVLSSTKSANLGALGWFAGGLVLSILMATISSIWAYRAAAKIMKARVSIDQSLLTGVVDIAAFNDFVGQTALNWKTWVPSYAGAASLTCLIVGMVVIACTI